MYRKVVIPLDCTPEAERVCFRVHQEYPDARVVLLQVTPPVHTQDMHGAVSLVAGQIQQTDRFSALVYLHEAVRRVTGNPAQWQCEVVVSESIPQAIIDAAIREEADLIAIYTQPRRGLDRYLLPSIAKQVRRKAPMDVRIFTHRELERLNQLQAARS